MRISDWSSDVCSSDLRAELAGPLEGQAGNVDAIPPVPPLQVHLARTVDADLGDVRRRHVPEDTEHLVLVVEKVVGDPCYGNVVGVHARLDRKSTRLNSSH